MLLQLMLVLVLHLRLGQLAHRRQPHALGANLGLCLLRRPLFHCRGWGRREGSASPLPLALILPLPLG